MVVGTDLASSVSRSLVGLAMVEPYMLAGNGIKWPIRLEPMVAHPLIKLALPVQIKGQEPLSSGVGSLRSTFAGALKRRL